MRVFSDNGLTSRLWDEPTNLTSGEVFFDHEPTDAELDAAFPGYIANQEKASHNATVMMQISALEAGMTQRRVREATLGYDGGWLKNADDLLVALRAQLLK